MACQQVTVERRDPDADELLGIGVVEARIEMGQDVALLPRRQRPGARDQLVPVAVTEQELIHSVSSVTRGLDLGVGVQQPENRRREGIALTFRIDEIRAIQGSSASSSPDRPAVKSPPCAETPNTACGSRSALLARY